MGLYLSRTRYSEQAFKGMIARPEDRTAAMKALFDGAGMKLLHAWFCPQTCEAIMITEGDLVPGATAVIAGMASGGITDSSTIELMTMQQLFEAMKGAAAVAAKYRVPGK